MNGTSISTLRGAAFALAVLLGGACAEGDRPAGAPGAAASPAAGPEATPAPDEARGVRDERRTVLFLGNSLTAGFGLRQDEAFPALVQRRIDAAGLPYRVLAAGLSGETSAGGLRRVGWYLDEPVDVLVLELGANDMLRGHDLDATQRNLQAIIDRVLERSPGARVVIVGMRAPPNLGPAYVERFEAMYRDLARANDAALVPFLLEGVAADPALNLDDGIHPNAAGHLILADNIWAVLEGVLREGAAEP